MGVYLVCEEKEFIGLPALRNIRMIGLQDDRIVGSDEALLLLSTFNSQLIMERETQSQ
jgi:hypothetical protein